MHVELAQFESAARLHRSQWTQRLLPPAAVANLENLRQTISPFVLPYEVEVLYRWHDGERQVLSEAELAARHDDSKAFADEGLKPGYSFFSCAQATEAYVGNRALIEDGVLPAVLRGILPLFRTINRMDVGVVLFPASSKMSELVAIDVEVREAYVVALSLARFVRAVTLCMLEGVYERFGTDEQDPIRYSQAEADVFQSVNEQKVMPQSVLGQTRVLLDDPETWPSHWRLPNLPLE